MMCMRNIKWEMCCRILILGDVLNNLTFGDPYASISYNPQVWWRWMVVF